MPILACWAPVSYGRNIAKHRTSSKMNIGDAISAKVVELENDRGFIELSLKDAGYTLAWDDLD